MRYNIQGAVIREGKEVPVSVTAWWHFGIGLGSFTSVEEHECAQGPAELDGMTALAEDGAVIPLTSEEIELFSEELHPSNYQ